MPAVDIASYAAQPDLMKLDLSLSVFAEKRGDRAINLEGMYAVVELREMEC